MNQKTNLIVLIIISLFLATMISRKGEILLLAIPFISYLVVGYFTSPTKVNLKVIRKVNNYRVTDNELNSMQISITNLGTKILALELQERVLPGITIVSGKPNQVVLIPEKKTVEFQYNFKARRGRYHWVDVHLNFSDPFQLFTKDVLHLTEVVSIVTPKNIELPKIDLKPRYTLRSPGLNLSNKPGSGVDFWGIRDFMTGDSLGHVHWRLSARYQNKFFVKQFEQENMADFGVLIDISSQNDVFDEQVFLIDHCIEAGAAISRSLLKSGNRVSMFVLGKHRTRVFPGIGKHHLQKIIDTLSECESGEVSLLDLMKFLPYRFFSSRTTIVLVSPLIQNDHSLITRLRAEGYKVLLICPNPYPSLISHSSQQETTLSLRAVRIEREIMLWKIRRIGVKVIDWPIEKPLDNLLKARSRVGS